MSYLLLDLGSLAVSGWHAWLGQSSCIAFSCSYLQHRCFQCFSSYTQFSVWPHSHTTPQHRQHRPLNRQCKLIYLMVIDQPALHYFQDLNYHLCMRLGPYSMLWPQTSLEIWYYLVCCAKTLPSILYYEELRSKSHAHMSTCFLLYYRRLWSFCFSPPRGWLKTLCQIRSLESHIHWRHLCMIYEGT